MTDLIIIGGGVAACSAGIFAGRRGLKTIVVARDIGGQTASTSEIDNYPGVGRIEGPQLIDIFYNQARDVGCEFIDGSVQSVNENGESFEIATHGDRFTASGIICAFGKTPKNLGIVGEEKYEGRGINYCNVHLATRYKDKVVAVVGGGNSALEIVWQLSGIARHIYLIHRSEQFRAEQILLERLESLANVEKKLNTVLVDLHGSEKLEAISISTLGTHDVEQLELDELFVAIGFESRTAFMDKVVQCDTTGKIIIDERCRTSKEGIFAAGDCTTVPYQQIVISAGEGAKAALSAYQYLAKKQGKRSLQVDWGFHA